MTQDEEADEGYLLAFASSSDNVTRSQYATKLGGRPIYPSQLSVPVIPNCGVCNEPLLLVLQAYAPGAKAGVERSLYVFGCNKSSCCGDRKAWVALRVGWVTQGNEEAEVIAESRVKTTDDVEKNGGLSLCIGNNDDIDMELLLKMHSARISESANEKVSKTSNKRKRQAKKEKVEALASSIQEVEGNNEVKGVLRETVLEVSPEVSSSDELMNDKVKHMVKNYKYEAIDSTGDTLAKVSQLDEDDLDESEAETQLAFISRIARSPKQCVRYKFNGNPSWRLARMKDRSVPACRSCGAPRVFETQILGSSLFYLKPDEGRKDSDEGGMAWSSIAVYVCLNDCWKSLACGQGSDRKDGDGKSNDGKSSDTVYEEVLVEPDDW